MTKRDKKDDEAASGANPYANCDKAMVLQEARLFNQTPINAKRCCLILSKLLYLINHGAKLSRAEATDAFFSITKLWQSNDPILRRLMYLGIKDLASLADDVIIVTSSLTKDMTGKEDIYRAAAIRALCRITDAGMLQAIERYMKQAIVDRVPAVASAALVSSLMLFKKNPDCVRRWASEIQEAVNSDNGMVQFHALMLLYEIRKHDRLSVIKMAQKYCRQSLRSPLAVCYLIRLCVRLIEDDRSGRDSGILLDFIDNCLRHKSEAVVFEAASALVRLPNLTSKELASAVSVLQLFCGSSKTVLRFAAIRMLNSVASSYPAAVTACNADLELLISDPSRSIATLAVTTLLKTGAESSVDRLMKQVTSFISDISDEFKVVVIDAIRSLCERYPKKSVVLLSFLSTMLRDEGCFVYKEALVDTIVAIIEHNEDTKEPGLAYLCEFIEDCEHVSLATKILHLLGAEGPSCRSPRKYIRFIFNRVLLEAPQVRAAAVTALAKFGARCADLRPDVITLLQRCAIDNDDEVRDRATCYHTLLAMQDEASHYITQGLDVNVDNLVDALQDYLQGPTDRPFDLTQVSKVPPVSEDKRQPKAVGAGPVDIPVAALLQPEKTTTDFSATCAEHLQTMEPFSSFGALFKSSAMVPLTDTDMEIRVACAQHMFRQHVVLQFDCHNTLADQILENVSVSAEPSAPGWTVVAKVPCLRIASNDYGAVYLAFQLPAEARDADCTMSCTLKYTLKEGEDAEGYQDQFELEPLDIGLCNQMLPVKKANFAGFWDQLTDEGAETESTFALTHVNTVQDAVDQLMDYFGLAACERSEKVSSGKVSHELLLSGMHRIGCDVAVKAKLAMATDGSVNLRLTVRCLDAAISELMISAIG